MSIIYKGKTIAGFGGGGGSSSNSANIDLSNLSEIGQQIIDNKANIDLSNLSEEAIQKIKELSPSGLPMFAYLWSDHLYNDASYLRADTFSWHGASIYVTAYETLLKEYNDENCVTQTENGVTYKLSPNGFKIADETQHDTILALYGTSKESWYYILDIPNTRFKLPRVEDDKLLYFYVGNYTRPDTEVDLGTLTELVNSADLENALKDINNVIDTGTTSLNNTISSGVSEIQATTQSGKAELNQIVADKIPPATVDTLGLVKPDGTSILIDELGTIFAEIPEVALATTSTAGIVKPDGSTITIVDGIISAIVQGGDEWEYSLGTNSYIKHKKSGLMIQGGYLTWTAKSGTSTALATKTITFPKPFSTKCCTVILNVEGATSGYLSAVLNQPTSYSTTNFVITYGDASSTVYKAYWLVFGY